MECTTVREAMLEMLYDEAHPEAARRVQEHVAACAGCRDELAGLRRVRAELRSFSLPPMSGPARRARSSWPGLAGLAAAAALVVGLGAAFVQARVGALEQRLAAQERVHARELAELRSRLAPASSPAVGPGESAVIARVSELLRDSEDRQARRLDASLRELQERAAAQRRYDMARVSAGLSYLDGRSGQHAARTAELMGYVLQAAEKK